MANERKVVLVTGASSGIGNSIATLLAKRGHSVYGTCRNPAQHPRSADEFFDLLRADVTDLEAMPRVVAEVLEREKKIDALVCSAGSGTIGSVEDTSIQEARLILDTNFFGTLASIKAVLPIFRAARSGKIIAISSLAGLIGIPFQSIYSSSKFALEGLIEALRFELLEFHIDACLIEPGGIRTGFSAARGLAEGYKRAGEASPYRRNLEATICVTDETPAGDPLEVAKLVERLLKARRVGVRYTVGPPLQRFGARLKRFLPSRLFESLIVTAYHLENAPVLYDREP